MNVRFGVSLPEELAEEVEELAKIFGYKTRSALIADAVKQYTSYLRLAERSKAVRGAIVVIFKREKCEYVVSKVEREFFTRFFNNLGMLIFFYEGISDDLRAIIEELRELKGVLLVLPVLLPSREEEVKREKKGDGSEEANE